VSGGFKRMPASALDSFGNQIICHYYQPPVLATLLTGWTMLHRIIINPPSCNHCSLAAGRLNSRPPIGAGSNVDLSKDAPSKGGCPKDGECHQNDHRDIFLFHVDISFLAV
jgi:hypothetical protein